MVKHGAAARYNGFSSSKLGLWGKSGEIILALVIMIMGSVDGRWSSCLCLVPRTVPNDLSGGTWLGTCRRLGTNVIVRLLEKNNGGALVEPGRKFRVVEHCL